MDLRVELRNIFNDLGFPLVGIARPEPLADFSVYRAWIAAGLHAGMDYLAQERAMERRADPRRILPEARSVAVVALPYAAPLAPPPAGSLRGRVAAYAYGADYHLVIPPRLDAALDALEKLLGYRPIARGYTDTGPVLERSLAQQAGLGWNGKNTCLIVPGQGSYFLIAELFLAVEIEPDEPFRTDHCGTCTRCIDACPTQCIRPDRLIDSHRCISYLTIENKGAIPAELRPALGDWIFGCDICQQVCPWNARFAPAEGDPGLAPRAGQAQPDLVSELRTTPQEFNRKFKDTPLARAKRRGYLRNVAVALGNSGADIAIPALAGCLQNEPEALVRAHAAWALGQFAAPAARVALLNALAVEMDTLVKAEIALALENGS